MSKLGLICTFAIIACHLASGSVQEKEVTAFPGFSLDQVNQFRGICLTALSLMPNQTSAPPPEKVIPSGFEKIGSRFFYISKFVRKNWFAAGHTCRKIGGQLATIQSEEELAAIRSHPHPNHLRDESYWIDMNDLVENGKYESWGSGKAASYFKWHPNQSEEKINDDHCVDVFQGEMFYDNCFKKNLFICQALEE